MLYMRTTITLEDDVVRLIKETMSRERRGFKETINAALRRALSPGGVERNRKLFKVVAHSTRLQAGVDPARLNQLLDEIDEDAFIADRHSR